MNWYIGQEIVAIKTHSQNKFKEGDIFTIKALKTSNCNCEHIVIDIGKPKRPNNTLCTICGNKTLSSDGTVWYSESSFKPLDELVNIDELTEILETTQPFEI